MTSDWRLRRAGNSEALPWAPVPEAGTAWFLQLGKFMIHEQMGQASILVYIIFIYDWGIRMYSVFHFFSSIGRKYLLETPKIDEKHTCIPVQFLLNQSIDPRRVIEVKRSVNRQNEVESGRDTRSMTIGPLNRWFDTSLIISCPNIPIRSLLCFWCWRCREGNVGVPPVNYSLQPLSLHLVPFPYTLQT